MADYTGHSPNVGIQPSPNVGFKLGPNVGPKDNPNVGVNYSPNVGIQPSPNVGLKLSPNVGPKHSPNVGPKHSPNVGPKYSPNVSVNHSPDGGVDHRLNDNIKHRKLHKGTKVTTKVRPTHIYETGQIEPSPRNKRGQTCHINNYHHISCNTPTGNIQYNTPTLDTHPKDTNRTKLHKTALATHPSNNTITKRTKHEQDNQQNSLATAREKQAAQAHAEKILSKSLNDSCTNQKFSWLVTTVKYCISQQEKEPEPHDITFENSMKAANINSNILRKYHYDFETFINSQHNTILTPGSEFRSIKTLEKLLGNHQDWHKIRQIISEGCDIPTVHSDANEDTRKADLQAMINRGNHKSTQNKENSEALHKGYLKEIEHGWMIPITIESIYHIKNAMVLPLGTVCQQTLDIHGQRTIKRRITHDCSFPTPSGTSMNINTNLDLLDECVYGHCLRRILHGIHRQRIEFPHTRILISKMDLDAAYRRLHMKAKWAVKQITIVNRIAYILTRLAFGATIGPSVYSTFSEAVFDLIFDLVNDKTWDPKELYSPFINTIDCITNDDSTIDNSTIKPAMQLAIPVPFREIFTDGYIDDSITCGLDISDNKNRILNAGPLIAHAIFRPVSPTESVKRNNAVQQTKYHIEGFPRETNTVLGWLINTRTFKIFLPIDKAEKWINDIEILLSQTAVTTKNIESCIGRLNHAGFIIPVGRYFLSRLRFRLKMCKQFGKQKLQPWDKQDLKLWITLLQHVSTLGIDINMVNFTSPTDISKSDACEIGLGGYNDCGLAWRYKLPPDLIGVFTINLLEFIAAIITIYMIIEKHGTNRKILAFTDSSSALGWMHHSTFNPNTHLSHDSAARKLAEILITNDSALYSQHIPGKHNIIADSLSRDHHIPTNKLTFVLQHIFPTQVPTDFNIKTPPKEIISWLYSLAATLHHRQALPQAPKPSNLGALIDGGDSWKDVVYKTNLLRNFQPTKKSVYSERLLKAYEEMNMANNVKSNWDTAQLSPPLQTYVRSSGRSFGGTQF